MWVQPRPHGHHIITEEAFCVLIFPCFTWLCLTVDLEVRQGIRSPLLDLDLIDWCKPSSWAAPVISHVPYPLTANYQISWWISSATASRPRWGVFWCLHDRTLGVTHLGNTNLARLYVVFPGRNQTALKDISSKRPLPSHSFHNFTCAAVTQAHTPAHGCHQVRHNDQCDKFLCT